MALDLKNPGARRAEVADVLQEYVDDGAFADAKATVMAAATNTAVAASTVSEAFSGPVGDLTFVAGRGPEGDPRRQTVGDTADPQSIARMGDIASFHDNLILDGGNF